MGNVCGCVRAEKEEQYVDPAKTPLSPEKHSPGRRYFRRKLIKKIVDDTEPVEPDNGSEGKQRSSTRLSREQPALSSRRLVQEESATSALTLEGGIQPGKTEGVADSVQQKLLPGASSSGSYQVNVSPAKDSEIGVKVSEQDERISEKDSTPYGAKRKKHLEDVSIRDTTFQSKTDLFPFRKAASLSPTHCATERSLGKSGFSEDPSQNDSRGQEKQNTERDRPHAVQHFQVEKKRCHSLCTNVPLASKDTCENEVSDLESRHVRCK